MRSVANQRDSARRPAGIDRPEGFQRPVGSLPVPATAGHPDRSVGWWLSTNRIETAGGGPADVVGVRRTHLRLARRSLHVLQGGAGEVQGLVHRPSAPRQTSRDRTDRPLAADEVSRPGHPIRWDPSRRLDPGKPRSHERRAA